MSHWRAGGGLSLPWRGLPWRGASVLGLSRRGGVRPGLSLAGLSLGLSLLAGCAGPTGEATSAAASGSASAGSVAPADAGLLSATPTRVASPSAVRPTPTPNRTASGLDLSGLAGRIIVIDPGHNGGNIRHTDVIDRQVPMGTGTKACDTTGTETNSGYQEAAFTFDVSTRLAALLRGAGANVILTRTDNSGVGPCVNQRAAIGNDNHAAVAISIHADGAPARGHGFHVLEPAKVGAPSNAIVGVSHRLALAIRDGYRARTGIPSSSYIGRDGINTRGDMGGLNLSTVPKVMVECGNMRNSGDAALMTSAAARQKMADGLAVGLAAFLRG